MPKICVTTPIRNLVGEPMKLPNNGGEATLRTVCVEALLAVSEKEEKGKAKLEKWELAKKIQDADGEVHLTSEQVAQVKSLIGDHYGPLVVGPAWKLLEGEDPYGASKKLLEGEKPAEQKPEKLLEGDNEEDEGPLESERKSKRKLKLKKEKQK